MKKKAALLIVLTAVLFMLFAVKQKMEFDENTYSEKYVSLAEVGRELSFSFYKETNWDEYFRAYHKKYLTKEIAGELLTRIGVSDYIGLSHIPDNTAVSRDDWRVLYTQILDYLDDGKEVGEKTVFVLGLIEREDGAILITNEGDYVTELSENYFSVWKTYDIFYMEEECVGIAGISDKEAVVQNAYLKSYDGKKMTFLFRGGEYEMETKAFAASPKQGVCDFVFSDGALQKIRTKKETIQGKMLSYDDDVIEIDGYGRIAHTGKIPVYYTADGMETEEISISDVVLGNMEATYVTGENEVCAILVKTPAVIENIRVLLLAEDGGNFRAEVFLKSDADCVLKVGENETDYAAGTVFCVQQFIGDTQNTFSLSPKQDNGKIYICDKDGNVLSNGYAGSMEARWYEGGYVLVNSVPFETYLYAVVPSEMPSSYEPEALKAQAVCARSYAYIQLMRADLAAYGAHINDSTSYQVYNKTAATEASVRAVNETASEVMTYGGEVIEAYYFSTSAGYTDTAEVWNPENTESYGYLKQVCLNETPFSGDLSDEADFREYIMSEQSGYDSGIKFYRWQASADYAKKETEIMQILENRHFISPGNVIYYETDEKTETGSLQQFGGIKEIAAEKRSRSGSVVVLKIVCENGVIKVMSEYNIRKVLGCGVTSLTYADGSTAEQVSLLPSAACTVERQPDGSYMLYGGGYGHGLGMSQNGANGLAKEGNGYRDILHYFYKDIKIESLKDR